MTISCCGQTSPRPQTLSWSNDATRDPSIGSKPERSSSDATLLSEKKISIRRRLFMTDAVPEQKFGFDNPYSGPSEAR